MTAPVCTQLQFLNTYEEDLLTHVNTQSSKVELAWLSKTVLLEMSGSWASFLEQSLIFLKTWKTWQYTPK